MSSGKIVKDYYIQPVVIEAMKANKYGAFEWDHFSDEED